MIKNGQNMSRIGWVSSDFAWKHLNLVWFRHCPFIGIRFWNRPNSTFELERLEMIINQVINRDNKKKSEYRGDLKIKQKWQWTKICYSGQKSFNFTCPLLPRCLNSEQNCLDFRHFTKLSEIWTKSSDIIQILTKNEPPTKHLCLQTIWKPKS